MKRSLFLVLALALLSSTFLVSAQDEVELRWRTRPDNQAEIDVYTAASEAIDEDWDGVSLSYEPGGSESSKLPRCSRNRTRSWYST